MTLARLNNDELLEKWIEALLSDAPFYSYVLLAEELKKRGREILAIARYLKRKAQKELYSF